MLISRGSLCWMSPSAGGYGCTVSPRRFHCARALMHSQNHLKFVQSIFLNFSISVVFTNSETIRLKAARVTPSAVQFTEYLGRAGTVLRWRRASLSRKAIEPGRDCYLSTREIGPALVISLVSAAGLTLRGGRAGGAPWPGAWLEDKVETGPPTPTLPPRIPSSAECCLEDCEFCESQRRPAFRVTTVGPPGPGWWPITLPLSSDVLCNRNPRPLFVGRKKIRGLRLKLHTRSWEIGRKFPFVLGVFFV